MRIRVLVEGQEGVPWEQWLALAEAAERSGIDGLFCSDHYNVSSVSDAQPSGLDAWATLAAIAARTERIRLGTLVSPVTFRHPSVLAKLAASVDEISGGRIELGIGAGYNEREHSANGFELPPLGVRMGMLEEQVEILHRLFTQDSVTFEGRHYTLDGCVALPKPVQRPLPLIMGGGAMPRSAALAARFATEYNGPLVPVAEIGAYRARLAEACERVGRDPHTLPFSLMTIVCIGTDRSELRQRARLILRRFGEEGGDPEELLAGRGAQWLTGTPDEAIAQLREIAATGVECVYLIHLGHEDTETIELLGAEVVPAVA